MKPMVMKALVAGGGAAVLLGFVGWRAYQPHTPRVAPNIGVVSDRSRSKLDACRSEGGQVRRALALPGLRKSSTLLVFATGDSSTLGEPVEVARLTGFKAKRAMESPASAESKERTLVRKLVEQCNALPQATITPIFLAIRRATEQLRAIGCNPGACHLFVQSDLRENVEPAIQRALAARRPAATLPAPIDNAGIPVNICGPAETTGGADVKEGRRGRRFRDAEDADRIMAVWRRLFTAPDLVTFEPHCPKTELSADGGDDAVAAANAEPAVER
jgi:hypothetical protein